MNSSDPPRNNPVKTSPGVPAAVDITPVRNELSRRLVLRAGSVFGLLTLAGCARPETVVDGTGLPAPAWPEPIAAPPRPVTPPTVYQPPVIAQKPVPQPVQPGPVRLPTGVIPRSSWTSTALGNPNNARPMTGISRITIHHDGTSAFYSESQSDSVRRLQNIRSAHLRNRSKVGERWADIGYHFIVDRAGRVYEGRPLKFQGAHVSDNNEQNIGIMCMGNFQVQAPSKAQTDRLDQFVAQLMREYRIPLRSVYTHRELDSTECPGRSLQTYMARTRGRGGTMALAIAHTDPVLLA